MSEWNLENKETEACPKCHEPYDVSVFSVVVSLVNWPTALLLGIATMIFGDVLGLSVAVSAFFAVLIVAPFCFSAARKRICSNCGIEFEVPSDKSETKIES